MQEGTILFSSSNGDPLTPVLPATKGMYRRPVNESDFPKIPAQAISYGDAMELLRRLGGNNCFIKLPLYPRKDLLFYVGKCKKGRVSTGKETRWANGRLHIEQSGIELARSRCVLGQDSLLSVPFSTQVYKWVLVNFLLGGSSAMKYRPIQGEIKILPVTSCCRTRNKPCDCKGGTGLKQPPCTYPCSGVREASMDEH